MNTDPFNIVKEELKKTINKTRSLIETFNAVNNGKGKSGMDETSLKLLADIRTNLRSINWDIQDLEETIEIASKNPSKYNLTSSEIDNRRQFISQTKEFVQKTKQSYGIDFEEQTLTKSTNNNSSKKQSNTNHINIRIPDIISNTSNKSKEYTRLNEYADSDDELDTRKLFSNEKSVTFSLNNNNNNMNDGQGTSRHVELQMQHEVNMFKEQDKNLELISTRVSSLKNISQTMQNELDDQANLLDDLGREMDIADSRMQTVMKKITKVLHMSNDRRQWTLIGVLLLAIFVVLILFAILP